MAHVLSYIAACIGIQAGSDDHSVIEAGDYRVHRRLWRHDTFDVHTLGAHHKVNFSYTLLDVFWNHVLVELEPIAVTDIEAQTRGFDCRVGSSPEIPICSDEVWQRVSTSLSRLTRVRPRGVCRSL
jgi:hypothetical protein